MKTEPSEPISPAYIPGSNPMNGENVNGLTKREYIAIKVYAALISLRGDMNLEMSAQKSAIGADALIQALNDERK